MGGVVVARRSGALGVLLLAALCVVAAPASAQGFCWRGRPAPTCSGFLIVDFHGHYTLAGTGREERYTRLVAGPDGELAPKTTYDHLDGFTWALGADVGYARNVAPDWAVGGTLGYEGVEGGPRTVLSGRLRHWLGHGVAVDVAPGIFRLHDIRGRGERRVTGALLGARLDFAGLGFLSLRWQAMSLAPERSALEDRTDPGGFQQGLDVGAGLGSQAGIVGLVVLTAVSVVALAMIATG